MKYGSSVWWLVAALIFAVMGSQVRWRRARDILAGFNRQQLAEASATALFSPAHIRPRHY